MCMFDHVCLSVLFVSLRALTHPGVRHGSLLDSLLNMQLASRNPFSGQFVADFFFGNVYWPAPFIMLFDFRPLLRITFAKISLFTDPGHQQRAHWRKSEYQGPWCLALAKPHFWKLSCCMRWSNPCGLSACTRHMEPTGNSHRLMQQKPEALQKQSKPKEKLRAA